MTIEDIEYLYENSEKDSFILYVDSADRDRAVFPKPSEYTITFDEPFKHVINVNVLDGSIPSTMFNIDVHNNHLAGLTYLENSTMNYTFQNMLDEFKNVPEFDTLFMTNPSGSYEVIVTTYELLSAAGLDGYGTDSKSTRMLFLRGKHEGVTVYEYDTDPSFFDDMGYFTFVNGSTTYAIANDPTDFVLMDLIDKIPQCYVFMTKTGANTYDFLYIKVDFVVRNVVDMLKSSSPEKMYLMYFSSFYATFKVGNYGISQFINEVKRALAGTDITLNATSAEDVSVTPKLGFSCIRNIMFNMEYSTIRTVLGFDELVVPTETTNYIPLIYGENKRLFSGVWNASSETYVVTAPGVVFLLGTRYCVLRCPEVEDHLYTSRAFGKFSPGIGIFKLFAVNDIAHQRMDFVNFHKKPFHPIGRLSKMTFRFETTNGSLYDFKAANHLMLISIDFLVPSQKNKFVKSILNPNYCKDYNEYMAKYIEYRESDDDDNKEFDQEDFRIKFVKKQNKYDYSSSDDESGGGDSSDGSEIDIKEAVAKSLVRKM
jgi:hypothetical protein